MDMKDIPERSSKCLLHILCTVSCQLDWLTWLVLCLKQTWYPHTQGFRQNEMTFIEYRISLWSRTRQHHTTLCPPFSTFNVNCQKKFDSFYLPRIISRTTPARRAASSRYSNEFIGGRCCDCWTSSAKSMPDCCRSAEVAGGKFLGCFVTKTPSGQSTCEKAPKSQYSFWPMI